MVSPLHKRRAVAQVVTAGLCSQRRAPLSPRREGIRGDLANNTKGKKEDLFYQTSTFKIDRLGGARRAGHRVLFCSAVRRSCKFVDFSAPSV